MKLKTKKTIAKRVRKRPSGLIEQLVVGHQHLRSRKSRRQKKATKVGTTAIDKVNVGVLS